MTAFSLDRLHEILWLTCQQFRKGGAVTHDGTAVHVFAMPHLDLLPAGWATVDAHFVVIGVDPQKAKALRSELVALLDAWPYVRRLARGPSYMEVGAELGDQGAALMLFGLGEVLELWKVITPERLGFEGDEAAELAGGGLLMISGYHVPAAEGAAP